MHLEIGDEVFEFENDIFDLEDTNLGVLNEQISNIPGFLGYVGMAYGKAEKSAARLSGEFNAWMASKMNLYTSEKSEGAKKNLVAENFAKEMVKYEHGIQEADYLVRLLKSYYDAVKAKWELSQTLSANIRAEREKYGAGGSLGT